MSKTARQLRRFENKAQLLRHIEETTDADMETLWEEYEKQVNQSE